MNPNMNSAEYMVVKIKSLSANASELSQLHAFLKQSDDFLMSDPNRLSHLLAELDSSNHSLGYLYILEASTSTPVSKERASEAALIIAKFIDACVAEQIRLAPDKCTKALYLYRSEFKALNVLCNVPSTCVAVIAVCKRFKDYILLLETPIRGVAPMLVALRKLQSSPEQLTALHPDFLLLCLLAKCYKTGLCILEDDAYEVDHPTDFFLYCYYGGMICIGQKQFRKATELLHNVVTAPMPMLSAIAIEAYKKYILVNLIHSGQFSATFPKYTSSACQRNLKSPSQIYIELANNYSKGKISELESVVQKNKEVFESDNNLGLVKQVVSSIYKRNIQRLTQTYLTLSLEDIAATVQLSSGKEAEMRVLQMIQDGEIYATINQKDGMVRFLEDPEQYKTCEMIEHIDSSIQRMMALSKKLSAMDELMSCDPLYLSKVGINRVRFDFDDFDGVPGKFNL